MRRRDLLRRVAAGSVAFTVAGCLGRAPFDGAGGSTDSATPTDTPSTAPHTVDPSTTPRTVDGTPSVTTRTPIPGTPRRVSLVGVDDGGLRTALDVAANATVVESRVDAAHTARVRLALENHGDQDRTITYEADTCDLNLLRGTIDGADARLLLAPAELDWTPADEDCWRVRHRDVSCGIPVTTHEVDVPVDDRVTWTFDLWATPRGPCIPPGRYRFVRSFDGEAATLTVTLRLTVPDS